MTGYPAAHIDAGEIGLTLLSLLLLGFVTAALFGGLRTRGPVDLALIGTPVFFAAIWTVAIEILSGTVGISGTTVWFAAIAMGAAMVISVRWWWPGLRTGVTDVAECRNALVQQWKQRAWWQWILRASIVLSIGVVLISLVVALISPPNNPDVLAYHLPRVMWWLHDGHVGTYVTADARQTAFPPLNSYALLLLKGLSSSDIPLNLVQWLAGAASALVVILIGRRAGLGRLALVVTAIFTVTIPTGITVATTAKADWLAALWPVLALAIVVSRSRRRLSLGSSAGLLALTAALAGATKPTSAVSVGIVVLLGVWWELRPPRDGVIAGQSWGQRIANGSLIGLASGVGVLAGYLPQALRTYGVYGNATGPDMDILVTSPSLSIVWGNTIRTILNNVGIPPPFSDWINPQLPSVLPRIGVPWRDDAALYLDATAQVLIGRNEDFATNPIHLILGLIACALVLISSTCPGRLRWISLVIVVTFIFLVGMLQWNVWTTRFLLSVLVLAALPLGWWCARLLARHPRKVNLGGIVASVIVASAALYGFVITIAQEYRPLVGPDSILTTPRFDQYFTVNDRPGTRGDARTWIVDAIQATQDLPDGARVGLRGLDAQEYLVWRFVNPDQRLTFINLDGPDGPVNVNPADLDVVLCYLDC